MTHTAIVPSYTLPQAQLDTFEAARGESGDVYVMTQSGIEFNISNPRADQVRTEDIAHVLSAIARFNGQTRSASRVLSVAQHSVEVMQRLGDLTDARFLLAALLHDAHEAYIGDITTPVALLLGTERVAEVKARIQKAIHQAYGLTWPVPEQWEHLIKLADRRCLTDERERFMEGDELPWARHLAHASFTDLIYRLRR